MIIKIKMLNNIIAYVNFHFPNYKTNGCNNCFIKSCLVYRYSYEKYFKKTIEVSLVICRLNDGFTIPNKFKCYKKNHLVFSYTFSEFYDYYKTGRGRVYNANTRL